MKRHDRESVRVVHRRILLGTVMVASLGLISIGSAARAEDEPETAREQRRGRLRPAARRPRRPRPRPRRICGLGLAYVFWTSMPGVAA